MSEMNTNTVSGDNSKQLAELVDLNRVVYRYLYLWLENDDLLRNSPMLSLDTGPSLSLQIRMNKENDQFTKEEEIVFRRLFKVLEEINYNLPRIAGYFSNNFASMIERKGYVVHSYEKIFNDYYINLNRAPIKGKAAKKTNMNVLTASEGERDDEEEMAEDAIIDVGDNKNPRSAKEEKYVNDCRKLADSVFNNLMNLTLRDLKKKTTNISVAAKNIDKIVDRYMSRNLESAKDLSVRTGRGLYIKNCEEDYLNDNGFVFEEDINFQNIVDFSKHQYLAKILSSISCTHILEGDTVKRQFHFDIEKVLLTDTFLSILIFRILNFTTIFDFRKSLLMPFIRNCIYLPEGYELTEVIFNPKKMYLKLTFDENK